MRKVHVFFAPLLIILLCSLTGALVYYNRQSQKIRDLVLMSTGLTAQWNRVQSSTYQILLNRYTVTGSDVPPVIGEWGSLYGDFSLALEDLAGQPQIGKFPEMPARVEGIIRVWRYTEVKLNNAKYFFVKILNTGLGEKVMVNGFLHTMYKLRMEDQLRVSEIFLLDDTLYALEALENASREFDILFNDLILELNREGEKFLSRIRVMTIGIFLALAGMTVLIFALQNQLARSQKNRLLYLKARREQFLREFLSRSDEESQALFRARSEELGLRLDLDRPIVPLILQIDEYSAFSHNHNIGEQQYLITRMEEKFSVPLTRKGLVYESLPWEDDKIVFLINRDSRENERDFRLWLEGVHARTKEELPFSLTLSLGEPCPEAIDLDQDVRDLLEIASYRFLTGPGSFLYAGSASLSRTDEFHYPQEKEALFDEAVKGLNLEEALERLEDILNWTSRFGPKILRRLILRLTGTISNSVEFLEKTCHLTPRDRVSSMVHQVQNLETLEEVRDLLRRMVESIIGECRDGKEEKHDQTVREIKDLIGEELENFNLSAEWIADRLCLTAGYVNRLFKQHTGLSIAGFINRSRLESAERMLRTTEDQVGEIAEKAGFASTGTFFRLFRKHYGRSPGEYQKERARERTSNGILSGD